MVFPSLPVSSVSAQLLQTQITHHAGAQEIAKLPQVVRFLVPRHRRVAFKNNIRKFIEYGYQRIYGLVFRVPTPPNGMGPQVAPPSLLFASYWQHF